MSRPPIGDGGSRPPVARAVRVLAVQSRRAAGQFERRRRAVAVLLVATLAVAAVAAVGPAFASEHQDAEPIEGCEFEIANETGTHYELVGDLEGTDHPCIYVESDVEDVTIDGNGHAIRYAGDATGDDGAVGVRIQGTGVTLRNVTVEGWSDGVYVDADESTTAGDDVLLHDVTVLDAQRWGLRLSRASNLTVRDVAVRDPGERGVRLYRTQSPTLENVTVTGSGLEGLYVQGGSQATVRHSAFDENEQYGIRAYQAELDLDAVAARSNPDRALALNRSSVTATDFDLGNSTAPGTTLDVEASDVWMDAVADPAPPPSNQTDVGRYVAVGEHDGDPSLAVDLHYESDDLVGVEESSLDLWGYDRADGAWTPLDGTWNGTDRTVSAELQDAQYDVLGAHGDPRGEFEIADLDAPSSVLAGEVVDVDVTVRNHGAADEQNVTLSVDGTEHDRQSISLEANETATHSLSWPTNESDRGDRELTVATPDDATSATVSVEAPPYFDVAAASFPTSVVAGESVAVNATVVNDGDRSATQNVTLSANDTVLDERSVTLDGGETANRTLSWTTDENDTGVRELTVASENDTASGAVTVEAPASFAVAVEEAPTSVLTGEDVVVNASVVNEGDRSATQNVTLSRNGTVEAVRSVSLNGSERRHVELTWPTNDSDRGQHDLTVASEDDDATTTVSVEAPASFAVAVEEAPTSVLTGEDVLVNASVVNEGDRSATQNVTLSRNGSVEAVRSVSLNGSERRHVELTWPTNDSDRGQHDLTVASEDDDATTTVSVEAPANLTVAVDDLDGPVLAGSNVTVDATISNEGDASGVQTIRLTVDGDEQAAREVDLAGGTNETVALDWTVNASLRGTYELAVATENDTDTTTVTAESPADFRVADLRAPERVAPDENVTVDVTVSNDGDRNGSRTVTLTAPGEVAEERAVTLVPDAQWNESLTWEGTAEPGEYVLAVDTGDDEEARTVLVEEPDDGSGPALPSPDPVSVTITGTNSPVRAGESLAVSATVRNVDDERFEDEVTLVVAGSERDSASVDLAPDESVDLDFAWSTSGSDVGRHTARVAAGGVSDTASVSVAERESTFPVEVESVTTPVVERQPVTLRATIEPNADDEQTVTLHDFAGETVDEADVVLREGDPATVELTWTPPLGGAGTGFVTAETADDSASAEVTVTETPDFEVAVEDAPNAVTEGENVTVEALVTSEARDERTGYVTLEGADVVHDGQAVTLASGDAERVTLTWPTGAADAGEHDLVVDVGSDADEATVTVRDRSGGLFGVAPEWTGTAVDYEPTEQTRHVGVFLWLTLVVGGLGAFVLATRTTADARLLGVTLLVAALRTGTDVLHATLGGDSLAPLLAFNTALEFHVGVLFLLFAAVHVGVAWPTRRENLLAIAAGTAIVTITIALNPAGLVFTDVSLAEAPFTYVTAETGPLGWVILTATLAALLFAVGLLVQSLLDGANPAWRPVGVLATGLVLAVLLAVLSVLDRGPLPHYDYTGAGMAGFLSLATTTLFGRGLQRIKETAQQSLVEDLDDPIVVTNDAGVVVEFNAAASDLLPGVSEGVRFDRLVGFTPEWPAPGATTTREETRSSLLPTTAGGGDGGAGRDGRTATDGGTPAPPSAADAVDAAGSAGAAAARRAPDAGASDPRADEEYFLVRTTAVAPDTGDAIGYTVRFTDVTELKRRTAELERKNEQLEQVASTVSHDLRNPLSVADGYVDLVQQTVPARTAGEPVEPADVGDHLPPIRRALDRMDAIIADILALARGDETVSQTAAVDFAAVVQEAWDTVDTANAALRVDRTGLLDADRDRVRRILENLFRNAVEHGSTSPDSQGREGAAVLVTAGLTEDGFFVEDDGPGVPPDEREAVFEEGYTSEADGTGLGLAIVAQLAEAHGWDVALDPDHEGARFVFTGATTLPGEDGRSSESIDRG